MTDREKVILALELCRYDPDPGQEKKWYHSCLKCPYCTDRNGMEMNCAQMYTDAIALLREQQPVEPKWINKFKVYQCGTCGSPLLGDALYCSRCGKKVKWDSD